MADPLIARSLKFLQRQPLGEVRLVEGPSALSRVPLRDEARQDAAKFITVHPIGALVGGGIVGEANFAAWHRRGHNLRELADLIIVLCDADVERLISDHVDRGPKGREKRLRDVLDVNDRAPRSTIGLHVDAPCGNRPSHQVVQHQVEADAGADAIRGRAAQEGRTETAIGQLGQAPLALTLDSPYGVMGLNVPVSSMKSGPLAP